MALRLRLWAGRLPPSGAGRRSPSTARSTHDPAEPALRRLRPAARRSGAVPAIGARLMRTALVLSGGIALGAFEAGLCAALEAAGSPRPGWLAASSAGAINAAILAGNPPERRVARLREFWDSVASAPAPAALLPPGFPFSLAAIPLRRAGHDAAALQTLLLGRPGLFLPRHWAGFLPQDGAALHDLAPLRRRLPELVDFALLNAGAPRLSVVTTDLTSGERVVFDTGRGDRIGPEHIVAACGLPPIFAPSRVEGRLLGDGGLSANTPLDLVFDTDDTSPVLCLVAELFAASGQVPRSLSDSLSRAGDLAFGNQTQRILEGQGRALRLRAALQAVAERLPAGLRADPALAPALAAAAGPGAATVVRLGYHATPEDAGPGKLFDFSADSLARRWRAGEAGLRAALRLLEGAPPAAPGLTVHEVAA